MYDVLHQIDIISIKKIYFYEIRKGHTEVQNLHIRIKSVYVILIINTPTNKSSQTNNKIINSK